MGNLTIDAWRQAGETGDARAVAECLAPDVVLVSPLTAAFRFHGVEQVTNVLASAFERPLPALTDIMAGIGPRLLRRQGQPGLARFVTLATAPLNAMARPGERTIMPKADPNP